MAMSARGACFVCQDLPWKGMPSSISASPPRAGCGPAPPCHHRVLCMLLLQLPDRSRSLTVLKLFSYIVCLEGILGNATLSLKKLFSFRWSGIS